MTAAGCSFAPTRRSSTRAMLRRSPATSAVSHGTSTIATCCENVGAWCELSHSNTAQSHSWGIHKAAAAMMTPYAASSAATLRAQRGTLRRPPTHKLHELSGRPFEHLPPFGIVLIAPLAIEARGADHLAERFERRAIEHHPVRGERRFDADFLRCHRLRRRGRGGPELSIENVLHVLRQALPSIGVREKQVREAAVMRQRAVLDLFVELEVAYGRQRHFDAVDEVRLQRRVDFRERDHRR